MEAVEHHYPQEVAPWPIIWHKMSHAERLWGCRVAIGFHARRKTGLGQQVNREYSFSNVLFSVLSELAVAVKLKLPWHGLRYGHAADVGDDIEVRSVPDLNMHRLWVKAKDQEHLRHVLVLNQHPRYGLVGWIRSDEAKRPEWNQKPNPKKGGIGQSQLFFVPHHALHDPIKLFDFSNVDFPY